MNSPQAAIAHPIKFPELLTAATYRPWRTNGYRPVTRCRAIEGISNAC
jgi:hypothetical protein